METKTLLGKKRTIYFSLLFIIRFFAGSLQALLTTFFKKFCRPISPYAAKGYLFLPSGRKHFI
jgi:hypothetical protein